MHQVSGWNSACTTDSASLREWHLACLWEWDIPVSKSGLPVGVALGVPVGVGLGVPSEWHLACPSEWDLACPSEWDLACPSEWDLACPLEWDLASQGSPAHKRENSDVLPLESVAVAVIT